MAEAERLPRPVPKRYDGRYDRVRCACPPPDDLLRGIEQFNAGAYWEQHETLERIWRLEQDDVRYLYQGILLVGVGFHHLRRNNHHGATVKLRLGLALLRPFAPVCQRVDVTRLIGEVVPILAALERAGPAELARLADGGLPRVHLVPAGPTAAGTDHHAC